MEINLTSTLGEILQAFLGDIIRREIGAAVKELGLAPGIDVSRDEFKDLEQAVTEMERTLENLDAIVEKAVDREVDDKIDKSLSLHESDKDHKSASDIEDIVEEIFADKFSGLKEEVGAEAGRKAQKFIIDLLLRGSMTVQDKPVEKGK